MLITTLADDVEVHPLAFVTVKVQLPAGRLETVVVVPFPVVVMAPGFRVRIQVPVAGRPVSSTLPVATLHVGWVGIPGTGADGVGGWALITTLAEGAEVHPSALVTVKA